MGGTSSQLGLWCSACSRQRDARHGGAVCSRKDKRAARCSLSPRRQPATLMWTAFLCYLIAALVDHCFKPTSVAAPKAETVPCGRGPSGAGKHLRSAHKLGRRQFQPQRCSKPRLRDFTFRKPFCPSLVAPQPQIVQNWCRSVGTWRMTFRVYLPVLLGVLLGSRCNVGIFSLLSWRH